MAVGKGMASGALPVGGVVMSREISAVMDDYRWETVSTFSGHPVVMAAVVANVEWVIEERIVERAAVLGRHLGRRLADLQAQHPCVAEVAGAGLLWAVELVRADGSGERFVPDDRHTLPTGRGGFSPSLFLAEECASAGSHSRPHHRTRCGWVRRSSTTEEHIDVGVEALRGALDELARVGVETAAAS